MADDLSKVRINIEARLDKLEGQLRQAEEKTKKAAKKMDQAVDKVGDSFALTKVERGLAVFFAGIGALEQAGNALTQMFAKIVEQTQKMNQNWAQTTLEISKAVPLARSFVASGEQLSKLIFTDAVFGATEAQLRTGQLSTRQKIIQFLAGPQSFGPTQESLRRGRQSMEEGQAGAEINRILRGLEESIERDFKRRVLEGPRAIQFQFEERVRTDTARLAEIEQKLFEKLDVIDLTDEERRQAGDELADRFTILQDTIREAADIEKQRALDALKSQQQPTEQLTTVLGAFTAARRFNVEPPDKRGQEQTNRSLGDILETNRETLALIRDINDSFLS